MATTELAGAFDELEIIGSKMGTLDDLQKLLALLRLSGVRPVIDSARPLAEARAAFERMLSGDVPTDHLLAGVVTARRS